MSRISGQGLHRRISEPATTHRADPDAPTVVRALSLSDETLGIHAKLDLAELDPTGAVPVEYKSGHVPDTPEQSWEPERVQLMLQGLLLRAHGHAVTHGVVYYAGSRRRVTIPFTPELEQRTRDLVGIVRDALNARDLPSPLEDGRKCIACSLAGICLPDETAALLQVPPAEPGLDATPIRRLYPARDDALPVYIQAQGSFVGKRGETLHVTKDAERIADVRLKDLSQLVLCGNVTVSSAVVHLLCEAGVPLIHLSVGHWFYGITNGITLRNSYDRAAQFEAAADPIRRLRFAKAFVFAKCANQRTLLRRNSHPAPQQALRDMAVLIDRIAACDSIPTLLGIEGSVAAGYFHNFATMLHGRSGVDPEDSSTTAFDFARRNRRPPQDPVNALLSFGYALLVKECTVALLGVGLDPYWGLLHEPRHGRPALALDLMEELRPVVADSAVLTALGTRMVTPADFIVSSAGCCLTQTGRKSFIRAFESRLDQLATHPTFDYRCSWRRMIALQAQLLARALRGAIPDYRGITVR